MYDWPSTKFESLYYAYTKRKVADELALRRLLEIASMWGNINMDSEENPQLRQDIQNQVDQHYTSVIDALYGDNIESDEEEDEHKADDPFFKAMERGMEQRKLPDPIEPPAV